MMTGWGRVLHHHRYYHHRYYYYYYLFILVCSVEFAFFFSILYYLSKLSAVRLLGSSMR